jgi:hypothetical protein
MTARTARRWENGTSCVAGMTARSGASVKDGALTRADWGRNAVPYARKKRKSFNVLAGAALAASLIVAPLVGSAASAAEVTGTIGDIQEATNTKNGVAYWEQEYAEFDAECYKHEGNDMNNSHGKLTDGGLTVTLNEYDDSWWGNQWVVLVVKAGNLNNVIENPVAGKAYASPVNNGGQQAEVSHWIVCKGDVPEQEPEQPAPLKSDKVETTFDCETDLATVTTTTTTTPYVWDEDAEKWVLGTPVVAEPVVTQRPLTDQEQQDCPPDTTVVTTEWKDGLWECGDTTVEQTREVTTTLVDWQGNPIGEPTVETETQTRELTQEELAECPLVPGEIGAVCEGDVPYLGYEVTLPEGYEVDSETPVRITFVNPGGEDYVVEDQPLAGALLWPGASATAPKMWPGWALVDGEYVETEGNYAWTREDVTVEFHVNPD